MTRILIMAGGTGGHVFPALAVARALQEKNIEVFWLGTARGLEAQLVPEAHIPISYINITGLRGKGWRDQLLAPWRLLSALLQAMRILLTIKPSVVIGMGGFVSGPGGLAAWLLRKPLVIHEQNSIAGMTNRLLATLATRVLQAFPNTFAARYRAITVGNPVREDVLALAAPKERLANRHGKLRLLVVGGSLGALAINQIVPETLAQLPMDERPEIYHQTGKQHFEVTQQQYQKYGIQDAKIVAFIDDMAAAYAWADLVLCRAGALTIAELTSVGVASILVPFPYAVDDHQTKNARYLVEVGAALLIPQTELNTETLGECLKNLRQRDRLLNMAEAGWQLRKATATKEVVAQCLSIINL